MKYMRLGICVLYIVLKIYVNVIEILILILFYKCVKRKKNSQLKVQFQVDKYLSFEFIYNN